VTALVFLQRSSSLCGLHQNQTAQPAKCMGARGSTGGSGRRSDREFLSPKETLLCCATFATALTTAMARARTKQVSVESTAFLFKRLHSSANLSSWTAAVPGVLADSSAREDIFIRSGLDWTLVRPPRLMNGHHSGRCPVRRNHLPWFGLEISRADVAHCVLGILDDQQTIRKVVGAGTNYPLFSNRVRC
jgi:hypothetical protein